MHLKAQAKALQDFVIRDFLGQNKESLYFSPSCFTFYVSLFLN